MRNSKWQLALALGCCICAADLSAEDKPKAPSKDEILEIVNNFFAEYNLNHSEKYIIDYYFTPFNGMYSYRELLAWAAQETDATRRADLVGIVRVGLNSVLDSGAGIPLTDGNGIGLVFDRSLPQYAAAPGEGNHSKVWVTTDLIKGAGAGGIGQSLAAKSRLLMLTDSGLTDAEAERMLASVLEEFALVTTKLFLGQSLGAIAPGAYVPDALELKGEQGWNTTDARSRLLSQASLLQGFVAVESLTESARFAALLPDGKKIAGLNARQWRERTAKARGMVFETLVEHHWDAGSALPLSSFEAKKPRDGRVFTDDTALFVQVLDEMIKALPANDGSATKAEKILKQLSPKLVELAAASERAPKGFMVKGLKPIQGAIYALPEALSRLNALLIANRYYKSEDARTQIDKAVAELREMFWSEDAKLFRSAAGFELSSYDGYGLGIYLAFARHMAADGHSEYIAEANGALNTILKTAGLMLSEPAELGETEHVDARLTRELEALTKSLAALKEKDRPKAIRDFVRSAADQDADGVPSERFAGGRHGIAPVLCTQAGLKTPYPVKKEVDADTEGKEKAKGEKDKGKKAKKDDEVERDILFE